MVDRGAGTDRPLIVSAIAQTLAGLALRLAQLLS
jgi:hypothetical protein